MGFLKKLLPKVEESSISSEIRQLIKEASQAKINIKEMDDLIEAAYYNFSKQETEVNHESVVAF